MPVYYSQAEYDVKIREYTTDELNDKASSVSNKFIKDTCNLCFSFPTSEAYDNVVSAYLDADKNGLLKEDSFITIIRLNGLGLVVYYKSKEEVSALFDEFIKRKADSHTKSESVLIRMVFHRIKKYMDIIEYKISNESNKQQRKYYVSQRLQCVNSVADMKKEIERIGKIVDIDIKFFDRAEVTDGIVKAGYEMYLASTVMNA